MRHLLGLLGLLGLAALLAAPVVEAQTVRADRVTLNAGPCVITSGSAAPNGSRVGNICDTFIQTGTGAIWTKTSGAGTSSGWIATLAGAGTPGALVKWTGTGATVGDSIAAEAAGLLTITGAAKVTGAATMNAATITTTAAVGGTLDVTGAATLHSILDVTGVATLRSDTSISGNTVLGGFVGSLGYASQITGWRITPGGAADVRYLFTDELRAKLFTADAESVLAGSMRVTKSYSTLAQPFTCPTSGTATLWVKDAATYGDAPVFENTGQDWVVIHTLTRSAFGPFTIADCVGTVSNWVDGTGANAGQQQWTFTRGAGANGGTMTNAVAVPVDQLVQDMGATGNGYIEMTAVDGANGVNAPYLQVNTWATSPVAANLARQCRLGNLVGIFGSGPEYGLACGATATQGGFLRLSNLNFEIRNVPIDLYDGATQVMRLNPAGPSLALGNPLPSAFAGAGTNAGLWAGKDSDGTYKVRIGDPTGNRLTYANGVLSIAGEGSGITNINGGAIQAGTITASALTINGHPGGAAINPDPNVSDATFWPAEPGRYSGVITTITDGIVGTTSLRSLSGNGTTGNVQSTYPIDRTKTYRVHCYARAGGGANGAFYLRLYTYSRANDTSSSTGSGSLGFEGVGVPSTWTDFTAILTPAQIPAGTTVASIGIYLNWTGSAGYVEAQDIRLEEVIPSTLIKDGAITTNKIQAGAITSDQIAANTITVGNLNATGFGDNLIKNSTFEGATHQLDGWALDVASQGAPILSPSCCGTRGPGTMYNDPAGGNSQIVYFAVPVQIGTAYRVALDVYVPGAIRDGFYVFMLQSNAQTRVARWIFNNGVAPDLTADSNTMLASNIGLAAGWTHLEFTYTVPNPTQWASFAMLNNTCPQASPCAVMHFDAIEMQPQLGSGHIRAASITADRLVANTITAAQIAGGTITGANIAGGTITGGNIAARTIISGNIVSGTLGANEIAAGSLTADRLVARTITSGYIATGTITANELAATSITADKLNVSSLSAISANLGTVNAGTINGVTINGVTISGSTIYAGGANDVTLNGSGITINSGTGTAQALKWNNGASISSGGGGGMSLQTQGALYLYAGCTFVANSTYFVVQNCSTSLGSNNYPWTGLFIIPPTNNAAGGGSSFYPLQLNINDNQVHRKTNGYDGQCVITAGKSLYIDHGIVVGCV